MVLHVFELMLLFLQLGAQRSLYSIGAPRERQIGEFLCFEVNVILHIFGALWTALPGILAAPRSGKQLGSGHLRSRIGRAQGFGGLRYHASDLVAGAAMDNFAA